MKRGKYILYLSLFIVSFFLLIGAARSEGRRLSTYSFQTITFSLSKPILSEIVYLPSSSFDEQEAIKMIQNLEKIDENILLHTAKKHIKIKLFQGALTDQSGLSWLKNKKPRGYNSQDPNWEKVPGMSEDRDVYVKIGHSEYGMGHSSVSLELHELAHAIDRHVFYYVRKDPIFMSIWKQEVEQLFPFQQYYINFCEEYFAETFAMFYYSDETKKTLQEKTPLTFKYIQSLEQKAAKMK